MYANNPITYNNHNYGIGGTTFASTPAISSFFNAMSTSIDTNGIAYVSTYEAFNYSIFGSQFHPEKA